MSQFFCDTFIPLFYFGVQYYTLIILVTSRLVLIIINKNVVLFVFFLIIELSSIHVKLWKWSFFGSMCLFFYCKRFVYHHCFSVTLTNGNSFESKECLVNKKNVTCCIVSSYFCESVLIHMERIFMDIEYCVLKYYKLFVFHKDNCCITLSLNKKTLLNENDVSLRHCLFISSTYREFLLNNVGLLFKIFLKRHFDLIFLDFFPWDFFLKDFPWHFLT